MKFRLFVFALVCIPLLSLAQRKQKPALLVFGTDVEALAAAVQSAKSSVPTLWVIDGNQIASSLTDQNVSIVSNNGLDGGIWMDLLMLVGHSTIKSDSIASQIKKDISAQIMSNSIEKIINDLPLLTILKNTGVDKISQGKRGWNVILTDRSKHEFRTVIDASTGQSLAAKLPNLTSPRISDRILRSTELSLEASRTTVAVGESEGAMYAFTHDNLLYGEKDNFFTLQAIHQFGPNIDNIPLRMQFAQALGAAAAYTAFFKTTSSKIDVRKLQTELMTYGSRLLPLTDISIEDPYFNAYQKIYLTGIFKNEANQFDKSDNVRFDEISPILNQLYSRSQLWFLDNKGEYLNWKDLIELVKFIGLRGDEVDRQIEKDWGSKLAFEQEFDPERLVTRAEFAVVLDRFANPYVVSISNNGVIMR